MIIYHYIEKRTKKVKKKMNNEEAFTFTAIMHFNNSK